MENPLDCITKKFPSSAFSVKASSGFWDPLEQKRLLNRSRHVSLSGFPVFNRASYYSTTVEVIPADDHNRTHRVKLILYVL